MFCRLTFCLAECTPFLRVFFSSLFPPFLSFSFLAFALGCLLSGHLFTLDRPCCDSWLQRATSFISHSSEGGGPFSATLKEREGTEGECMKKRGGMRVWKESTREKEDPFLTAGDLRRRKRGKRATHPPIQSLCWDLNPLYRTFYCFCFKHDPLLNFPSVCAFSSDSDLSWQCSRVLIPVSSHNPPLRLIAFIYLYHFLSCVSKFHLLSILLMLGDILRLLCVCVCVLRWLAGQFSGQWELPLPPFSAGVWLTLSCTQTHSLTQIWTLIVHPAVFVLTF